MKALIIFLMIGLGMATSSIDDMIQEGKAARGIWSNGQVGMYYNIEGFHYKKFICPKKFSIAFVRGGIDVRYNTSWKVYCTDEQNLNDVKRFTTSNAGHMFEKVLPVKDGNKVNEDRFQQLVDGTTNDPHTYDGIEEDVMPFKMDDVIQAKGRNIMYGNQFILVTKALPNVGVIEIEFVDPNAEWCKSIRETMSLDIDSDDFKNFDFHVVVKQKYTCKCKYGNMWKNWYNMMASRKERSCTRWKWALFCMISHILWQMWESFWVVKDYFMGTLQEKQTFYKIDYALFIGFKQYIFFLYMAFTYDLNDYCLLKWGGTLISIIGIPFNVYALGLSLFGGNTFSYVAVIFTFINGFFNAILACKIFSSWSNCTCGL